MAWLCPSTSKDKIVVFKLGKVCPTQPVCCKFKYYNLHFVFSYISLGTFNPLSADPIKW